MRVVRVEKAGNRILVGSATPIGLKATIPGAYFRKDGFWSVPLEMESCVLLRERFGKRLEIGPNLLAWAKAEKAQRSTLRELAGSEGAELRLLPDAAPILAAAMDARPYQPPAVRFIADAIGRDGRRRALVADTVGLGKTVEALGGVLEAGATGPFLIVCPKTAVNSTWKAEINRWLPGDEVITIPDGRATRDNILNSLLDRAGWARKATTAPLARTWVVIHPAAIRTETNWICALCSSPTRYTRRPTPELDCGHAKDRSTRVEHDHTFPQLFAMEWGAMIVDESHQILIMKTGTPNLQRTGADLLSGLVRSGGVRIALSGTPFRSKPQQTWSTLNWLDPIRWGGKWRWLDKYWEVSQGGYGGSYTLGEFREERQEMLDAELSDVMIRRERAQVRSDLPAKLYAGSPLNGTDGPFGIWLDMTPKQEKAYRQMEKTATASFEGGEISAIGVLAEMTRLKQFAGSTGTVVGGEFVPSADGNKYEWLVQFLDDLGFPDRPSTKVVVVSQFTQLLNAFQDGIRREFKLNHGRIGMITGEVTQGRRDAYIADFEDPKSDLNLMMLNTIAGGASITLDEADVMVFLDETYVDDDQEQAEGRIDNRNPERKIVPRTYYYLRSRGTIEERIAVANAEAKAAGKRILKPAELAKQVLR